MHLLQDAKCGQNAQVGARLLLKGTRVVYDPAVAQRALASRRKTREPAFSTPDESIDLSLQPATTPTLDHSQSGPTANTLCYQSTHIPLAFSLITLKSPHYCVYAAYARLSFALRNSTCGRLTDRIAGSDKSSARADAPSFTSLRPTPTPITFYIYP